METFKTSSLFPKYSIYDTGNNNDSCKIAQPHYVNNVKGHNKG